MHEPDNHMQGHVKPDGIITEEAEMIANSRVSFSLLLFKKWRMIFTCGSRRPLTEELDQEESVEDIHRVGDMIDAEDLSVREELYGHEEPRVFGAGQVGDFRVQNGS